MEEERDQILQLKRRSLYLSLQATTHLALFSITHKLGFFFYSFFQEDPETRGEVTGNRGSNCGSEPLGVDIGDGCK